MERISCVICHHQGNLVLKAISSILLSRDVEIELIVVTSQTGKAFYSTKTVHVPGGPARKRNIGYRYCTSPYIAFFDDDVEVEPTAIAEMLKVLKKDNVGMVFGKLRNMEFRDMFDEAGSFLTWTGFLWARGDRVKDVGQFDESVPVLAGKSAACIIRKEAFSKAGFFDESYEILGEESDLSWRVWLSGYKVIYSPRSLTYHAFNTRFKPANFYTAQRVYFNGCRNYLAMLTTNLGWQRLLLALPFQLFAWTTSALGMFFSGKLQASLYIFEGLGYYFTHLSSHLEKRKGVQSQRMVKESELMAQVMQNPSLAYFLKRLFRYIMTGLHG